MNIIAEVASRGLCWIDTKKHGRSLNIADVASRISCTIARRFGEAIEGNLGVAIRDSPSRVASGTQLQNLLRDWLNSDLHERGLAGTLAAECNQSIEGYYQYQHLADLRRVIRDDPTGELEIVLGGDYLVQPDVVVHWLDRPWRDLVIQETGLVVRTDSHRFMYASVSCKWTLRSDRAQNVRREGANLLQKRRGAPPHFVCVTCEPLPGRLASVAGGDGDVDTTYHLDLQTLWGVLDEAAAGDPAFHSERKKLETLIRARKLRPLVELPGDIFPAQHP